MQRSTVLDGQRFGLVVARPIKFYSGDHRRATPLEVGCLRRMDEEARRGVGSELVLLPLHGGTLAPGAPRGGFFASRRSLHRSSSPVFVLGIDHVIPVLAGRSRFHRLRFLVPPILDWMGPWFAVDRLGGSGCGWEDRLRPRGCVSTAPAWQRPSVGSRDMHEIWEISRMRFRPCRKRAGLVGKKGNVRCYAMASSYAMRFEWTDATSSHPVRLHLVHARPILYYACSRSFEPKGNPSRGSDVHALLIGFRPLPLRRTCSYSGPPFRFHHTSFT